MRHNNSNDLTSMTAAEIMSSRMISKAQAFSISLQQVFRSAIKVLQEGLSLPPPILSKFWVVIEKKGLKNTPQIWTSSGPDWDHGGLKKSLSSVGPKFRSSPVQDELSSHSSSTGCCRRGVPQGCRDSRCLGSRRNTLYDMSCLTTANMSSCLAL